MPVPKQSLCPWSAGCAPPAFTNGRLVLCRDWLRGKCRFGATCSFPHPPFDLPSGPAPPEGGQDWAGRAEQQQCASLMLSISPWVAGHCCVSLGYRTVPLILAARRLHPPCTCRCAGCATKGGHADLAWIASFAAHLCLCRRTGSGAPAWGASSRASSGSTSSRTTNSGRHSRSSTPSGGCSAGRVAGGAG